MKKVLSLFLVSAAIGLQAQTMLVNDFESGLNGAYVAWNGSCEVIDNPNKNAVNGTDKVLKVISEDYAPVGFPVTLPEGKTLKDYTGIRFKAAMLDGNTDIHWVGFNIGASQDKNSMDILDPTGGNGAAWGEGIVNNWVDVELLFNETLLAELVNNYTSGEYNVMIKIGKPTFTYVVDEIRLIEKEVLADPNTIFTFETMDLGPSVRCGMPWAGSCEVVENPYKSGINASNKVLSINNPEFSPVTLMNALPEGKKWSDYSGMSLQICMVEGQELAWGGIEIGIRKDDGAHVTFGGAYDDAGQPTAAWGDFTMGEWMNIELTIKEDLVTTEIELVPTLFIRLMKSNMKYLLDNVTLKPTGASGVDTSDTVSDLICGGKGTVNLELDNNKQVVVYTIAGQRIINAEYSQGNHAISLPAGIYIVNGVKVVVY